MDGFVVHVVVARGVRFPDVDFDVRDRCALRVADGAEDEAGSTVGVVGKGVAGGKGRGVVGVEGAEDGAFGCGRRARVGDGVDEDGEAEDVGEEDEFLKRD